MAGSFLVVNMRGMINTPADVKKTLENLNLEKRFRATIVPDTPSYRGMLQKVKDHVSWCQATPSLISLLLTKRGRKEGWRPLLQEDAEHLGFESLDRLAENLSEAKVTLNQLKEVKPFLALSPPRGGFKASTRRSYGQGGILGENPDLAKIIDGML